MTNKNRSTLAILGALAVVFIVAACVENIKPVAEMTPKEKATFFMSIYSDQAENYKTLAASPDLTDAQKTVLRTKKQIMTEVYPLISLYSDYVDAGAVPDAAVETQIIDYLDRLARTVTQ
jgi:hypothetical protein